MSIFSIDYAGLGVDSQSLRDKINDLILKSNLNVEWSTRLTEYTGTSDALYFPELDEEFIIFYDDVQFVSGEDGSDFQSFVFDVLELMVQTEDEWEDALVFSYSGDTPLPSNLVHEDTELD